MLQQQQATESDAVLSTTPTGYTPVQTQEAETRSQSVPEEVHTEMVEDALTTAWEEQTCRQEHAMASASALTALIQRELRLKRRDDYVMLVWTVMFTLTMFAVTHSVVNRADSVSPIDATTAMKYVVLLLVGMGVVTTALITRRSYRRKTALTQELGKSHDAALIGPLVDTLNVESTPVRNLSKRALIPLLPGLQASDAGSLTEARRDRLLRLLAISPNDSGYRDLTELFSRAAYQREIDLRVSILKAFEQVGGAKELPAVLRLSQGKPFTLHSRASIPKEVQQAAHECLPYLQNRVSDQRASKQLLRASSAQNTATDVLLRPANGQPDALPEQLLRASEGGAA